MPHRPARTEIGGSRSLRLDGLSECLEHRSGLVLGVGAWTIIKRATKCHNVCCNRHWSRYDAHGSFSQISEDIKHAFPSSWFHAQPILGVTSVYQPLDLATSCVDPQKYRCARSPSI